MLNSVSICIQANKLRYSGKGKQLQLTIYMKRGTMLCNAPIYCPRAILNLSIQRSGGLACEKEHKCDHYGKPSIKTFQYKSKMQIHSEVQVKIHNEIPNKEKEKVYILKFSLDFYLCFKICYAKLKFGFAVFKNCVTLPCQLKGLLG